MTAPFPGKYAIYLLTFTCDVMQITLQSSMLVHGTDKRDHATAPNIDGLSLIYTG